MNSWRYRFLGAFVWVVAIGVWAVIHGRSVGVAEEADADPPTKIASIDCASKLEVPTDPAGFAAFHATFMQKAAAYDAAAFAESRLRATRWVGCKYRPEAAPERNDEFERQRQIAELFCEKDQIPNARTDAFQWVLSMPNIVCVGWNASVSRVVGVDVGKRIEVVVSPILVTKEGAHALTSYRCRETWTLSATNDLSFEKIEPEPGGRKLLITL